MLWLLAREEVFKTEGGHTAEGIEIRVLESNNRTITIDIRKGCQHTGEPCVVIQENM